MATFNIMSETSSILIGLKFSKWGLGERRSLINSQRYGRGRDWDSLVVEEMLPQLGGKEPRSQDWS